MTLTEWVDALNARIKDGSNALFTAAEKQTIVQGAVAEYARARPRRFDYEVLTVAGQQTYDLPEGCLWVMEAALPSPGAEDSRPDGVEAGSRDARGWLEDAGLLWLFPVPQTTGLKVRLTCAGTWDLEEVPAGDTDLVLVAAHARCCEVLATDTARAFAFWVGDEKFDKSQVSAHYLALARELRAQFRRKLARG